MRMRNSLMPAAKSCGATMAKLLVATLAFTAAYAGADAVHPDGAAAGAGPVAATGGGAAAPVHLTPASTRALAVKNAGDAGDAGDAARPEPGTVAVTATPDGSDADDPVCRRTYHARGLVTPTDGIAIYHWRLLRWSDTAKRWRAYMSAPAGFTGDIRTVHWRPQIVANPGWYRVELKVQPGGTYRSRGFHVSC